MSYNFLERLTYSWQLVRETPRSQKFLVTVDDVQCLKATFDIHFTTSEIAYASAIFIGSAKKFTDEITNRLFSDLETIIRRHCGYEYIDFSLVFSEKMIESGLVMANF